MSRGTWTDVLCPVVTERECGGMIEQQDDRDSAAKKHVGIDSVVRFQSKRDRWRGLEGEVDKMIDSSTFRSRDENVLSVIRGRRLLSTVPLNPLRVVSSITSHPPRHK